MKAVWTLVPAKNPTAFTFLTRSQEKHPLRPFSPYERDNLDGFYYITFGIPLSTALLSIRGTSVIFSNSNPVVHVLTHWLLWA